MRTLAAILTELRSPLQLAEIEVPAPDLGQVLVRITHTRICGSQLGEIDGAKGPDRYLPHLLGHEACGVVEATGPEVARVNVGDQVVCHWRPAPGLCLRTPRYTWQGRTINAGAITTFQQHALIAENRLTPVPAGSDPELCCLLADTLTTGFGTICNKAHVMVGESVVVIGVGGIGLGAVLGARLAGAHPVVAVDIHAHKLDAALRSGATHGVKSEGAAFAPSVEAILGGKADVVIDATGNPSVLAEAFALAGPQGRCVGIGVMRHDQSMPINTLPLHFGKVLTGSQGGESQPARDIPRYLRMWMDGRYSIEGWVTHRCGLRSINEAIACMRSGESLHTVIQPWQ